VCVFLNSSCTIVCCALVIVTYIDLLTVMQQMPLPPSICQRLTSSSTLMNLAQALAYHKMYVPLAFAPFFFLPTQCADYCGWLICANACSG